MHGATGVGVVTVELTRAQVLAHRHRAQGLDRVADAADVASLAVWDLGLQDSPAGGGALALAARLPGGATAVPDLADGRRVTTVWATRGAPLVLRNADVARFAAALWPLDAADAVARLAGNGQQFRRAGLDPVEAIRVTAEHLAAVVTEPMTKGEASEVVTPRLPEGYAAWCRPCQATHVGEQLMRLAALPAGLKLVPDASPATLAPIARWKGAPEGPAGVGDLVQAHLHLYGPATRAEVGAFLGTTGKAVKAVWPEDLVEVMVDGRKAWAHPDDVDALTAADAPEPEGVRLLPRSDPWLLARDRERLVPAAAHRKAVWPVIGWPGAVLVDGEVVGVWRTKSAKGGRALRINVEAFSMLAPRVRKAVEAEAAHVATLRGTDDVSVTFA